MTATQYTRVKLRSAERQECMQEKEEEGEKGVFSFPKVYPFCFRILSELMRSTHRHTHMPDVQNTQGEGGALISSYLLANSDQIFF